MAIPDVQQPISYSRSRQFAALNTVSALLSTTLDPILSAEYVMRSLSELAGSDGAALVLYPDDGSQRLGLIKHIGTIPELIEGLPPILLLSDTHYTDQQPFSPTNIATDPHALPIRTDLLRQGFLGLIELPLVVGSELLGEMVAYFHSPPSLTEEDLELLRLFTNQAALALNHARLHNRLEQQLHRRARQIATLAEINQELTSTLDLGRIFELLLDRALSGTSSSSGVLLLRPERASDPMQIVAQRGVELYTKRRTAELLQRPTIYRSLTTNQALITRDQQTGHAELSVPISREGDLLGVISLQTTNGQQYTQEHTELVGQLANQALIALDNARLFHRIEENRDRLQVILDTMNEALLLLDRDGAILIANPQINTLFGLRTDHLIGKTISTLLGEPRQRYAKVFGFSVDALRRLVEGVAEGAYAEEGMITKHTYHIDLPTPRYIERTVVHTHDHDGKLSGVLMVFADVTQAREEAEAREDLSRMIVHDVRSPLTAITTSIRLIAEIESEDPSVRMILQRTTDASQRALRKVLNLVDSLLDIAKMDGGQMSLDRTPSSLRPIAESVQTELSPIAMELEITTEILIDPDLPNIPLDVSKMERVLLNLMDNALKFTPADGLIQIRAQQAGEVVRVEVCDNGPGIPDDYKSRIFDRFQQVDGSTGRRRGTGLGLTFCKLTVEAHGGHIWIEDNPGGGSIFVFTLPLFAVPGR
jgi:signal transduction histidine kinase